MAIDATESKTAVADSAPTSRDARTATTPNRCRNCGAEATWNYCPSCGQETLIALPPAFTFLRDAAGRYIAFDGRMWRTLFALAFRPGLLTREYLAGRRRRYVRPARLFVALSIVLFAVMRLTAAPPSISGIDAANPARVADEATPQTQVKVGVGNADPVLDIDLGSARVFAPIRERIDAFNKLPRDIQTEQVRSGLFRYAPYAAVALLPFFALLLALAFAGGSRRYPERPRRYAAHLVFGAHLHAFAFAVATVVVLMPWASLRAAFELGAVVYGLVALRVVYGGSWPGIVLRAALIALFYVMFFAIAFAAVVVAAILLR
jgi:rRNA maturation protein Nop10